MTFLQRPSTRSLILWIILIRSVVFLTFWFLELNYGFRPTERIGFFFYGNDAHSYLDPIETFVDHGAFLLDGEYSAFRMPGYLLLYGIPYFIIGQEIGLLILSLFNLIIDVASCVLLFKLLVRIVKPDWSFLILIGYLIYPRIASFGYLGMPEVVASFCLIGIVYCATELQFTFKRKYIWFSALLITQLVFMKPIAVLLIPVILAHILYVFCKNSMSLSHLVSAGFSYLLIPCLAIGIWTVRNYMQFDKIMPLSSALTWTGPDQGFRSFCRRTGLEFQSWHGDDARAWFVPNDHYWYNEEFANSNPFPDYIYTSVYNLDSLVSLRSDWHRSIKMAADDPDKIVLEQKVEMKFLDYANSFIFERPFHFLVTIRVKLLSSFLFIKDSFSPFSQNSLVFLVIRILYFATYYFLVLGMLFTLIAGYIKRKEPEMALVALMIVVFIGSHVLMGRIENRYLLPILPLGLIGYAWLIKALIQRGLLKANIFHH